MDYKKFLAFSLISVSKGNAFVISKNNKVSLIKTNMVHDNNKHDEHLFENLFQDKNRHGLSDENIHSGLEDYKQKEVEYQGQLLEEQKDILNDLSNRANQHERIKNISKLLTTLRGNQEINLCDDIINPSMRNDTLIFQGDIQNKVEQKNTIFINHNFISTFMNTKQIDGDNPLLQNIPIKERVFNLFKKTKFDTKFMSQNTFLQQDSQSKYPMTGGIIRGTYRNKEVYFLLTKTLDKQFRLINISDNLDDLKTKQTLN